MAILYINNLRGIKIMKKNNYLLLAVFTLFLGGCASFTVQPNYFQSVGETDNGTALKAYVGDILYTKYDYESRDFVRLTFENSCGMGCTLVATDTMFLASQVNSKYGACGMAQTRQGMMGLMQPMNLCVVDEDRDEIFESWASSTVGGKLKNPVPYQFQTADSVRGKKKELIYQGKQGDTLRFRYREYINDIVRPAFDQTVEYNLDTDKIVTFRGMKILVDYADNQEIAYRIVSGTIEL